MQTEASSSLGFQLNQTFFIHSSYSKRQIHEEIFDLVWLGHGRWDWHTVYNWPIWLRKFYQTKLLKMFSDKQSSLPPMNTTQKIYPF